MLVSTLPVSYKSRRGSTIGNRSFSYWLFNLAKIHHFQSLPHCHNFGTNSGKAAGVLCPEGRRPEVQLQVSKGPSKGILFPDNPMPSILWTLWTQSKQKQIFVQDCFPMFLVLCSNHLSMQGVSKILKDPHYFISLDLVYLIPEPALFLQKKKPGLKLVV